MMSIYKLEVKEILSQRIIDYTLKKRNLEMK